MKHILIISVLLLCFGCKPPEARLPESVQSGTFLKESAQRNKKLNALEKQQIEAIIKNNPNKNYLTSESGFWYYYNFKVENDTTTITFGDAINFDYSISNLEGTEIYSTQNRTYVMDKEELFTGLREGLKLMKPTEHVTFIFPSQKAFGYYGDDNKIGTNIPIICNVTLNSILKNNN
ncbi:MAG: gliding motility-associated peptidyl-prolyl isomerase GldI [Winogradskyella sp.]